MPNYSTMNDADLLNYLENNDLTALEEACNRCGYMDEYNNREQVIDNWPHDDDGYDAYTHQGLLNYTDSILMDLCIEWLRYKLRPALDESAH